MALVQQRSRILIVRLSAVGDCITTLPMLSVLRHHMPEAFIAWAVESGPAALLEGHPHLDATIRVPKGWLRKPWGFAKLRQRLRAANPDLALDPQSLMKSSALAWLSGAKWRVGFPPPRGRELAPWLNNVQVPVRREHVVDQQLDLLTALGIDDQRVEFVLPEAPDAAERMDRFLGDRVPTGRFAVISPGAGWESRIWPADRFGRVAAYLAKHHDLRSVVGWAGQCERSWAKQIVEVSGGRAVMAPPTSLPELAVLLRRCCLHIAGDTGPTHLAAAVGTPCVALFGPTRPEVCGPYGKGHVFLRPRGPRSDRRHRRRASNEAMRMIEVADVCEACSRVIGS